MAQVSINTTGWSQEKKNLTEAAAVALLFGAGITYEWIDVDDLAITVQDPSSPIEVALSQVAVDAWLDSFIATLRENELVAQAEQDKRDQELATSEWAGITLAAVDTRIDAISNLASAKDFLKKLVRYLVARRV